MDEKILTAVSTSLALMQIQVNALLLLFDKKNPQDHIRDEFQRLISEGVETLGMKTMAIKDHIREAILQQYIDETGLWGNG